MIPDHDPLGGHGGRGERASSEARRLAALRRYEGLGPEAQAVLERISRVAAHLFGVPVAKVTFVGDDHEWSTATVGEADQERGIDESFCVHAIQSAEPLVVEDATQDDRFSDFSRVKGESGIRFYTGAPLEVAGGYRIGTLCVTDVEPQTPSRETVERLEDLAGMVVDELEVRRTRAALREEKTKRERLLGSIAMNVSDGICRATPEDGTVFANEAYAQMFGYEDIGEVLRTDTPEFYEPSEASLWKQIREQDGLDGVEVEFSRKDGGTFVGLIHGTVVRDEEGNVEYVDAAVTDITVRKEVERELRRTKQLLETTFESLNEAVLVVDPPNRRIITCNSAVEEIFGYEKAELIGKSTEVLHVDEEAYERFGRIGEPVLEEEGSFTHEYKMRRKDGGVIETEHVVTPLESAKWPEGVVSVVRDITERKRRQRRLVEAKEAAEKASRLKTAMLANMSHEIRTPLTSIIGFSENLEAQLEGTSAKLAGVIHKSSRRLLKTLESVLQLSQLQGGSYEFEPEPVPLGVVIRAVVDDLRPKIEANALEVRIDGGEEPVCASADVIAMRRILVNLLDNAIKFTPEGGWICVRSRAVDEATVVLEVEDSGVGIGEDARGEVFQAFKQESEGVCREYEGIGLGLSIVREMTAALGGTVALESETGVGTCVSVRLPRAGEPALPSKWEGRRE